MAQANARAPGRHSARYGITLHLSQEMDRDELIQEGFVSHQATTGSDGHEAFFEWAYTRRLFFQYTLREK
jgi:hypothetical protein